MSRTFRVLLAILALVAAACGPGDTEGGDSTSTTLGAATTVTAASETTSTVTAATTTTGATTTTTLPPPTADELVAAINEWGTARTSLMVATTSLAELDDGRTVAETTTFGQGSWDGGYGPDSAWWGFEESIFYAFLEDADEPVPIVVLNSSLEVDGVAYDRSFTDGEWTVDEDHDHTGSPLREIILGTLSLEDATVVGSPDGWVVSGAHPDRPDEIVEVVAARDGSVFSVTKTSSIPAADSPIGVIAEGYEGEIRWTRINTIVSVDDEIPTLVGPTDENMAVWIGTELDVAVEFPSGADWTWSEEVDGYTIFAESAYAGYGFSELVEPGLTVDEMVSRRQMQMASQFQDIMTIVAEGTTLEGLPMAQVTDMVGDLGLTAHVTFVQVDGGGVAIWYITETNEAVEELSMVMYLAQSVRTVDPDLASIWRDPSRFVWEG